MLFENIRIALGGLFANKLRTLLSVLGIMIGVMSVTLLLAVGSGASKFVSGQVASLGTNTLYIFLRESATVDASATKIRKPALTKNDVRILSDPAVSPAIVRVAPELTTTATVTAGRLSRSAVVTGTVAEWAKITNRPTGQGLMFNTADVAARRRVAVIGTTVASRLFPNQSAVGRQIRISGATFDVIGVFTRKGAGLIGDQDSGIVIPETAMQDTLTGSFESYYQIIVQVRPESTKTAADQVKKVLMAERRVTEMSKVEFDVFDNAELARTSNTITLVFRGLLGLIAGISLLVGGIGVMNIMLVTVTERTREIGIRKALGAKRWHLLLQFLVESVVLTGVGGVLGASIGSALSLIKVGTFAPVLQFWMIGLSVGVSALIGVAFGVYPANKAAKLRPIDALRFE
jgi:putative ABC transport system permease protein